MLKPGNPGKKKQVISEEVLPPYTPVFPIFTIHAMVTEKHFLYTWDLKLIGEGGYLNRLQNLDQY
jgi:hypothetical protein